MGIISDIYTHETGPQESEKITETQKMKKTPAPDRPLRVPSVFCELIAASHISAMIIPIVPKRSGFLRPTRSRMKTIKKRSR